MTIRNRDLTAAYMRNIKRTFMTNNADDLTPLLPFFILDIAYQLYLKYVLPLDCSHEAQRWKNVWSSSYNKINAKFFSAFDDNQRDAVIERMDSLAEWSEADVSKTLTTLEHFLAGQIPQDKARIISVCMVCNVLAQCACIIWEQVYCADSEAGKKNVLFEKMAYAISRFLNNYHRPASHIRCNDDPDVDSAVVKMQARIVGWLRENYDFVTEVDDKT